MTGTVPRNPEGRSVRRIGMRLATVVAALAVTTASGGLLSGSPASAHAQLLGSDPRADSTVTTPLDEITLTFNEPVRGNFSTIVVTGPDGTRHGAGQPRTIDKQVHLAVEPVRSGGYRVAYRVVSADGHPIQGQFRFTVTLSPALEPTAAPVAPAASDGPSASPAAGAANGDTGGAGLRQVGAVGLGVALVGAGFLLLRRRRRTATR
ncbi:copper resistance protein CopC [Plantactinospora sp. BC1]|nr:copper resistance protein CopC [Plantactinospora sp. BC1]